MRCFFTNEKCNEMMRWISLINKLFSDIISQGSVATRLRCGGIFNECCIALCNSERIFKIGQHLTKLCVEHLGFTFFGPPCTFRNAVPPLK